MKKYIFILILGIIGSCKDDCPDPDTSGSNNGGNSSNEYVLKGKLLDGTTMTAKYPGMVLTAVLSKTDVLGTETEELGQTKMDNDGNFEFTYKHNKLAENSLTKLTLRSNFYISPLLPKNQDVDTVIYESLIGRGVINFLSENPISENDTFYIALVDSIYTFIGPMNKIDKRHFACNNIKAQVYNFWAIGENQFKSTSSPIPAHRRIDYTPSGDPYIDTLTVEY
jgi:hypothetical protein